MRIQLLFSENGVSRELETLDIPDGARLKHMLQYLKQRGDWNGADRLKVWINGHAKNNPETDVNQELFASDLVTIDLPQTWQVD